MTSKHNLGSYAYNLRNTLRKLEGAANDTINWLDASPKASKEEYEERRAELERIAEYVCFHFHSTFLSNSRFSSPIIRRLYIAAGGAPRKFPDGFP